jgi:hypothetical protein
MKALVLAFALMLSAGAPVEAASWNGPIRLPWYGSDYFGKRTACGQRYSRWIVGVATWKRFPCGTIIELRWNGRTVRAPVIDRMPRHPWAVFDASAHIACELLNPRRLQGVCFTRSGVTWRRIR